MTARTITLTIPDELYQQVAAVAQATHRLIDEVFTESLNSAFPRLHVNPRRQVMQREIAAFEAMHPTLWQQYPHHYVAIYQGKVIDHDRNQLHLLERIDQAYPQSVVLIRQVESRLPKTLRFRSPRWVK